MARISFKNFNRVLMRIFQINLIILTVVVCAISVNSSRFLEFKDLPEENFVDILQTKTLLNDCDDTGLTDCSQEDLLLEAFASGIIFDSDNEFSYILTANHFCNQIDFPDFIFDPGTIETDFWITDSQGRTRIAEVVYSTSDDDLCLMRAKIPLNKEIEIATTMPAIGEKVYAVAAPHAIRPKGVTLHFEGIFSGCDTQGMCYYTIPATSGSSGSLVFDHRGRIIGMIQMTAVGFNAISIGAGAESIRLFVAEASSEANISL